MIRQWNMTAPHRILLDNASFKKDIQKLFFVSFPWLYFNVKLSVSKYRQYYIHPATIQSVYYYTTATIQSAITVQSIHPPISCDM